MLCIITCTLYIMYIMFSRDMYMLRMITCTMYTITQGQLCNYVWQRHVHVMYDNMYTVYYNTGTTM